MVLYVESLDDEFVIDDRLIWLEVEGAPLCAWSNDNFKKYVAGGVRFYLLMI